MNRVLSNLRPGRPFFFLSLVENAARIAVAGLLTCVAAGPAHAADEIQTGPAVVAVGASMPAETAFVNGMHAQLDRAKRYPTGREASLMRPSGTSTVWVDVARDGTVAGRGLAQSSGAVLLDGMATSLVARTHYAALPADAWAGASTHRFRVSYRFAPVDRSAAAGEPVVEVAIR